MRAGELEAEPRQKRFNVPVVAAARQCLRAGLERFTPLLNLPLQFDELIQRQPSPRDFDISQFLGEMRHVDGVRAGGQRSRAS